MFIGCGDGYCASLSSEDCFSCPSDCFCNIPGWLANYYDGASFHSFALSTPTLTAYISGMCVLNVILFV